MDLLIVNLGGKDYVYDYCIAFQAKDRTGQIRSGPIIRLPKLILSPQPVLVESDTAETQLSGVPPK